jgi:hypothetical protein
MDESLTVMTILVVSCGLCWSGQFYLLESAACHVTKRLGAFSTLGSQGCRLFDNISHRGRKSTPVAVKEIKGKLLSSNEDGVNVWNS